MQIDLKPTGPLVKWIGPDGGWLTGWILEPVRDTSSPFVLVQPEYGRNPAYVYRSDLMQHSREDKE